MTFLVKQNSIAGRTATNLWNMSQKQVHTTRRQSEDISADWRTLELTENSDQEQVRQAYLKLAKKYHPDCGGPEACAHKFQKIDDSYRNLLKRFADYRHNRHKIEGEYGLYYDLKMKERRREEEFDELAIEQDIQHVAPQHRQYLTFEGVGAGTPFQREKQYQTCRAIKLTENLSNHRISQLEDTSDIKEVTIRNAKESKKIKTGIGIERLVEDLIQESMARGDFAHLSGIGKPLKHDDNPHVDFTTYKMNQLLIDNGFTPEWIMLGKEIRETTAALRKRLHLQRHRYGKTLTLAEEDDWRKFIKEFQLECDNLNSKINKFNLVVPFLYKQVICFRLDVEVRHTLAQFSEEVHTSVLMELKEIRDKIDKTKNKQSSPSLIESIVSMFKIT